MCIYIFLIMNVQEIMDVMDVWIFVLGEHEYGYMKKRTHTCLYYVRVYVQVYTRIVISSISIVCLIMDKSINQSRRAFY